MDNSEVAYIELFGETLSGVNTPTNGLYWTDLEGWWGLPDMRSESDNIPGAHGSFVRNQVLRGSRVITLVGHILGTNAKELAEVRYRLETALSSGVGTMRVVTSSYGAWSRVVEVDSLTVDPDHGKAYTKFTVDMVAPDPRRYMDKSVTGEAGLPVRSGGLQLPKAFPWDFGVSTFPSFEISNHGSVPLTPLIYVAGSASSITVWGGPRRIEFGSFSGTLEIDNLNRRVILNGIDVTRHLIRRDWFTVPVGDSYEFYFEAEDPSVDTYMFGEYRIGAW